MNEHIIAGIFSLVGVVVGCFGTYFVSLKIQKYERNRQRIKKYLEEIKGFYNLEQLYVAAVVDLRQKLPDESGSKTSDGVKREFRRKNEENGNFPLTMTSLEVDKLISRM